MSTTNCPQCGAPVPVRGRGLPYAVCAYCQSVIARDDAGEMAAIGTAATLPEDVSPLQLGSGLVVDGARFGVVGRVRWGWADGGWNEWLLQSADHTTRWLGEAMGQFQLLSERTDLAAAPLLAGGQPIRVGDQLQVDGAVLTATDVKQVACLGGEGDLPFPTPHDWVMTSVDFRSPGGEALSVQRDAQGVSVYSGHYVELAELQPSRLRALEGWRLPDALKGAAR